MHLQQLSHHATMQLLTTKSLRRTHKRMIMPTPMRLRLLQLCWQPPPLKMRLPLQRRRRLPLMRPKLQWQARCQAAVLAAVMRLRQ